MENSQGRMAIISITQEIGLPFLFFMCISILMCLDFSGEYAEFSKQYFSKGSLLSQERLHWTTCISALVMAIDASLAALFCKGTFGCLKGILTASFSYIIVSLGLFAGRYIYALYKFPEAKFSASFVTILLVGLCVVSAYRALFNTKESLVYKFFVGYFVFMYLFVNWLFRA